MRILRQRTISSPEPPTYSAGAGGTMVIDHLHGRHAMPENIGPVRRLWMMTLFGEPPAPAASTTSTYVCSSAAKRLSTRRAAATTSLRRRFVVACRRGAGAAAPNRRGLPGRRVSGLTQNSPQPRPCPVLPPDHRRATLRGASRRPSFPRATQPPRWPARAGSRAPGRGRGPNRASRCTQVFLMQPSKTPGNQLSCDGARYTRVAVRLVLM